MGVGKRNDRPRERRREEKLRKPFVPAERKDQEKRGSVCEKIGYR